MGRFWELLVSYLPLVVITDSWDQGERNSVDTYLAGLDENGCASESSTPVDQQIINTQAVDLTSEDWSVEAVIPLDTPRL